MNTYTPIQVTERNSGQQVTVYNQDPATRTFSKNVLTTVPNLLQTYNGVEVQVNTRLHNATVFGGITIGRDYGDQDGVAGVCSTCADLNNPNNLINNKGAIGFDSTYQIRGGFSYQLPAGLQLSGSVRAAEGLPQTRTYVVTTKIRVCGSPVASRIDPENCTPAGNR